jgi:hypothetical protein
VLIATARAVGSKDPNPEFRNPDYLALKFLGPRERAILSAEFDVAAIDLDFDTAMKRLGMHVRRLRKCGGRRRLTQRCLTP